MKKTDFKQEGDHYKLNKYQKFYVDQKLVKEHLLKIIKFPVVVMDTEFFNRSHDKGNFDTQLYNEAEPSLIYTLSFSFAQSYMDLLQRKNKKAISTLYVRRRYEQKHFNFKKTMDKMLTSFVNTCLTKEIKTLVFAGQSNDVRILERWINQHPTLLNNKTTELFFRSKATQKIEINTFDIYKTLENGFSFTNFNQTGIEFYNQKNLKPGKMGEKTVQLPGLAKFFDYFDSYYQGNFLAEKTNIYQLCISALEFYTIPKFADVEQFNSYNEKIREVRRHCQNDVLKLLYLINFIYVYGVNKNSKVVSDEKM